jgi:hypothetical protein
LYVYDQKTPLPYAGEGEAEKKKHRFFPLNDQQELGCGASKRRLALDKDVVSWKSLEAEE